MAVMFAVFFGAFGAHQFYLGNSISGIIRILITVWGSCIVIGPVITMVISIIEAIKYYSMSDEEFEQIYVLQKREWF